MKQEFFDTAICKKIYTSLAELERDLDEWLWYYNIERPHSGRYCYGKRRLQPFEASEGLALEKDNELVFDKGASESEQLADKKIG